MASGSQKSLPSLDLSHLTPRWKYDVYLSFGGTDTWCYVLHLELRKRGVKVFMGHRSRVASSLIPLSLPFAMVRQSRLAIVVLSPNYALDAWCLEELTEIVQCMEKDDRILPVFYGVDPSDVLHQKGRYGEAMVEHERSEPDKEKLNQWMDALRKVVANVPGLDSKNFKTDTEFVEAIVDSACSRFWKLESEEAMPMGDFERFGSTSKAMDKVIEGSTSKAMDKVIEALKDDEISMIGVYGMPGVGKTTMVQQVAAQACRMGLFDCVILAVISQSPDLRSIQDTLAGQLGVKLEGNTEEERVFRLNKIMRRNNLLIILDDIWERIELSRIGLPSYYKLKICNSKVLLTTRLFHVCRAMECQAKISLDILSEADAWKLFKKEVRRFFIKSSPFYQIAKKVIRECCGLPIELIPVARALRDKDQKEWEIVYERLQKSRVANLDDEGDAFKCIKLSYDYLKDEDCKSFFLLCCLFPKDYDIPIKDIFEYGYGKGLFQDADTIREARETAYSVVIHLKNSSLLMDSEEDGCVRMHAVIRDTAIQIAQCEFLVRARCYLRSWPFESQEAYSAISLMWNQIYLLPPKQLVFPKLQILLLNNNGFFEIPESSFQSPNELRVLDLSGNRISLLPKSFSLLTNLRALHLDDCPFLDDISVVGKLEKLEILSMKNSGFKELPREIGDLTNLRIFDITYAKIARIPSKVISNLQRLEELYMCCEFRDWGSNAEGQEPNASFEEVISLGNLRVLRVCISHAECIPKIVEVIPNWVEFDITIGKEWWGRGRSSTSTRRMVEINANSTLPDWFLNVVISKPESNINYECGVSEVFEATTRAMLEVIDVLKDDEISVIGVYGMGGVGKTTMVEYVSQEAQNQGLFDKVIKVVITQTPDLRRIQGTLAGLLGVRLEEETEFGRSRRLMQKIRNCNKILIILEDMWEKIDFSSLGIPRNFELQRCSSKVLFTARRSEVWHSTMSQATISLDTLSEEDSWNLFVKNSKRTFESSTKSYDIARMIARQCDGLPVSLIAVAKALGDEDLDEWKVAARRLKESPPANHEDLGGVFKCIKLSYDYLRSDDAKLCFLLCCLFPEQSDIHIEDLLKYGMGLGSFGDSETAEEARASAHVTVKYLKARNLLLETEQDGCIRMHDVIRDVAIIISSEDGPRFFVKAQCELKEWPMNSDHEGYYAISLMRNKICKLPKKLVCSKLHLLFLQSNFCLNEIPEDFFRSLIELRVLDLSQTRISSLPTSLSLLVNLYTLYLDGCFSVINNISILGNLRKLEILSMREVPLVEVPKEIGKLTNLRMLDLTGECADIVPSKVICNLAKLEELYMQCNFADWGSIVERNEGRGAEDVNATFDELTGLSHLNILKVFISDANSLPKNVESEPEWVCFDICINRDPLFRRSSLFLSSSPAYPRALTLDTTTNVLPGWFINVVTGRAQKLRYVKCRRLNNILVEHDRGKLYALEYFSVIGPSDNLVVLMDAQTWVPKEPVFQKLEELHLAQLDCLEALCVGVLPLGSLCNLRLLNVKHCYELVNALLPLRLLQRLQNLERLFCEEMDKMEYVFGCKEIKPVEAILGKLIELRLENLVKLIQIWDGPVPSGIFANLQTLVVLGCFKLENLFTAEVAQCLLHLEDLSVALCPMLDSLIRASEETLDNHIVFPKLKNLALIKLPQLTSFCSNTETVICCCLLEYLYVESCPQFSPSDFHSRNKVQINHKKHMDILLSRSSSLAGWTQESKASYSKTGLFLRNEPDLLENCSFGSDPRKRKRI